MPLFERFNGKFMGGSADDTIRRAIRTFKKVGKAPRKKCPNLDTLFFNESKFGHFPFCAFSTLKMVFKGLKLVFEGCRVRWGDLGSPTVRGDRPSPRHLQPKSRRCIGQAKKTAIFVQIKLWRLVSLSNNRFPWGLRLKKKANISLNLPVEGISI
jgi:hypothetical protein